MRLSERCQRSLGGGLIACVAAALLGGCGLVGLVQARDPKPRSSGRVDSRIAARVAATAGGRLLTVHFYSAALKRRTDYLVYLPLEYSPRRPAPAFYMLHGMPGRPLAFTVNADVEVRLEQLIRRHRVPPMILVFPDGRIDGNGQTDSEWANTPAGHFDRYVVDVVHDLDARFATIPKRQDRVIAGLSAGAYGAINVGLHHLDVFGSIQVWSGYFKQTRTGVFDRASSSELAYNSPIEFVRTLARRLREFPLRAFLFVGRDESDRGQLEPMAAALKAQGADVGWAMYAGGHSWRLWRAHLDQMLLLAADDMRRRLPPTDMRRRPSPTEARRDLSRFSGFSLRKLRHERQIARQG